eukprot:scaffold11219_cov66-Phaeocystis_antarctica.AAC.1
MLDTCALGDRLLDVQLVGVGKGRERAREREGRREGRGLRRRRRARRAHGRLEDVRVLNKQFVIVFLRAGCSWREHVAFEDLLDHDAHGLPRRAVRREFRAYLHRGVLVELGLVAVHHLVHALRHVLEALQLALGDALAAVDVGPACAIVGAVGTRAAGQVVRHVGLAGRDEARHAWLNKRRSLQVVVAIAVLDPAGA